MEAGDPDRQDRQDLNLHWLFISQDGVYSIAFAELRLSISDER
jgi:hypothetical protein